VSRVRQRVCLQDGPCLKLAELSRLGLIRYGEKTGWLNVRWSHPFSGDVAAGILRADLSKQPTGSFEIEIEGHTQEIEMIARPRHFGGHQWYFQCPRTGLLTSAVWKPPGATEFASRRTWSSQVAYLTQFGSKLDRAHLGKARIASRLINRTAHEAHHLPARPFGMRTVTYEKYAREFARYEAVLADARAKFVKTTAAASATDFDFRRAYNPKAI
jgi:hypothetical protein